MRRFKGFTIVELLTVIAIIAVLIGILVPSLNMVRKVAKKTEQKAMFNALDQGIIAFKQDYGDYPPSDKQGGSSYYLGGQQLCEALLGWDLMGFHPESDFMPLGHVDDGGVYEADNNANLEQRRDRYIDIDSVNVYKPTEIYNNWPNTTSDRYVLCDVFTKQKVTGKSEKAGTPIVYFKANTSSNEMDSGNATISRYNYYDNFEFFDIYVYGKGYTHDLGNGNYRSDISGDTGIDLFYSEEYKIIDREVLEATNYNRYWPHRPDSYILISAGPDGNFGTEDDITNF